MKTYLKYLSSLILSEETGQALILVLVFVLLGSLTVLPTLSHMTTALKTGMSYENKTNELFTADAGIENGLWRIKYDSLGPTYDPYDYSTVWTYQTDQVNNRAAAVTVQNVWLPSNVTLDSLGITPEEAAAMVDSEKLSATGTSGAIPGNPYSVKLEFTPSAGDNLTVKSIGVWLPQGFTYTGNCTLDNHPTAYYAVPVVTTVPGGQSVVWTYNSPYLPFNSLPNCVTENNTTTSTITFRYAAPAATPNKLPLAVAWVTTDGVSGVPIAWDTDTRFYKIVSATGRTQIETYSSKSQLRKLGDAIAGSYVAIGNSLMIGDVTKRDQLLSLSSTNVSSVSPIPADGDVISAILYWSGFRLASSIFSDSCDNFYHWDRESQTRVPASDNASGGTWSRNPASPTTNWDKVDETSIDDTDYVTGNNSGSGNQLFNFSPFTVPADSTITDITVYYRAKDNSSGTNNIQAYLKVNGTLYNNGSVNPGSGWSTYSYAFTTNPKTGSAWLLADINGTGTNPLQNFGVYSSDLSPGVQVSMVFAEVNYSLWTVSSGQFRGQGSANMTTGIRTLTLKNSLDLSSYTPGTVALYWNQDTGGTLESSDNLVYALSADGGATWSSNIEAFHDDNPTSPFWAILPTGYLTDNFKFRFYFSLNDAAEYVYLDNIKVLEMPPDTAVTFKINGQQVYLDASGDPQAGAQDLTASTSAVLINRAGVDADKQGYSFACHRDVSKLVKKYPVVAGEQHHNGNALYTVGDVTADTGQFVSYAGWSLIIIYSSPATAGHYLYLSDIFAFDSGSTNLDFDGDGQPGGEITGFVIPEPIRDRYGNITESVSANITCFVGEGDAIYTGDTLVITGQQSANSKSLSNSASPSNNIWNGADTVSSYPGIDVDTFCLLWADNILTPGDTRLHLDMNSGTDAWNLIYVIVSVRSETVTGGTENYVITAVQ
jgi:hypothetical protein